MFVRGILAIGAGMILVTAASYGADVLLQQVAPTAFDASGSMTDPAILGALVGFGAVIAALAGWTVAAIARGAEMRVATLFALLLFASSAAAAYRALETAPLWYHIASVSSVTISTLIGAWIRRPRRQAHAALMPVRQR